MRGSRLLVLDAAGGKALAAIVQDDAVRCQAEPGDARGLAAAVASLDLSGLTAVAVTTGPGSFTGLRTALALALGVADARGISLIPVTVAEALGEALPTRGGRALWVALDSRRGRIFLDLGAGMQAVDWADIPDPAGGVAIAGDAARELAARLAARGADVVLTDARHPRARDIARAALRRLAGDRPPLEPVPLYVDPPAARLAPVPGGR